MDTAQMPEIEPKTDPESTEDDGGCRFNRIEEASDAVVDFYRGIESPETADGVLLELESRFNDIRKCGCNLCTVRTAQVCETHVVIREIMKMVPSACENGVAGLIYRLHESRDQAISTYLEVFAERFFWVRAMPMGVMGEIFKAFAEKMVK